MAQQPSRVSCGQPGALDGGAGGGDVPLLHTPIPRASRETQVVLDFVASIPEQHVAFPEIATFRKIPARALLMRLKLRQGERLKQFR